MNWATVDKHLLSSHGTDLLFPFFRANWVKFFEDRAGPFLVGLTAQDLCFSFARIFCSQHLQLGQCLFGSGGSIRSVVVGNGAKIHKV